MAPDSEEIFTTIYKCIRTIDGALKRLKEANISIMSGIELQIMNNITIDEGDLSKDVFLLERSLKAH